MKKKVALIGANGIPARYGGFETLTEFLAKYLGGEFDITVYCSKTSKENRLDSYLDCKLVYIPFYANGWQSIFYDACSIVHALLKSEVLVILGFSGAIAFPLKILFPRKKIIFNIGGVEWKKVRGKQFFGRLEIFVKKIFELLCVRFSDLVVTDNQVLWDFVYKRYRVKSELIEYGGDHAEKCNKTSGLETDFPFLNGSYDLSVSRAQEDMNIHLLIDSYKKLTHRHLVIISNWNTSEYGRNLHCKYKSKYPNITLQDAIYDLKVLNVIRSNAQIYLHTHSLCGTAPSLTEAMSLGLPILCYDVDTNRSTTENKSYYFKDSGSLVRILSRLNREVLGELGARMKEIAIRRYTWKRIVGLYKELITRV